MTIITQETEKQYGYISRERLMELFRSGDIDTLIVGFVDLQGRVMGKMLTADYCLENDILSGTKFCNYLLGSDIEQNPIDGYKTMSWDTGYGDWTARPDWNTLRVLPWHEKTAIVLSDVFNEEHEEVIISPRNVLIKQIERVKAKGLFPTMVSELEFYLFKESFESAHERDYRNLKHAGIFNEDYNLLQGSKNEPFYRHIRNLMKQVDIPIESSKGEAYLGQHEINMKYADALTSADNHILFKHGMKEICIQNGYSATFMAKPHHDWTGSSGHIHLSLTDESGSTNYFYDSKQPKGMSKIMQHFLAGILAYTRDFSIFFAPYVNSYKRFVAGSWAPINIVWSRDNRTSGYRIVGEGRALRIENRIPGADFNPYLAYAAMLGAGLTGIEKELPLIEEISGNAYKKAGVPRIPSTLYEAIECWKNSSVVKEILGEEVAAHYLHTAETEQEQYNKVVTEWEIKRNFEQC